MHEKKLDCEPKKPKPKKPKSPKGKSKPKKPKSEPKKPEGKAKPKKSEPKKPEPKKKCKQKVIVEIEKRETADDNRYDDKLKHLLFKIKNQNNYTDAGIRFGWKN